MRYFSLEKYFSQKNQQNNKIECRGSHISPVGFVQREEEIQKAKEELELMS